MKTFRPYIPIEVRCRVVQKQLGEMWPMDVIDIYKTAGGLRRLLDVLLRRLAALLNCDVKDLHLDHDPPIAGRPRKGEGKHTVYTPDANDPEYLIYREKHAHGIKTRVRGEHGQYSDLALIKRERRRTSTKKRPKRKWPSRKLQSRGFL